MVAATVPLAILANVVRLTTIIVTSEVFGQAAGNHVHESWWASLLPYIPMIGGVLLVGHWLREKKASIAVDEPSAARWSTTELGAGIGVVAALFVVRDIVPALKDWTHNHQYVSAMLLVVFGIAVLRFVCMRREVKAEEQFERAEASLAMRPWSTGTIALSLLLIASSAGGLHYRQGHQKLGSPGVRVVEAPIYDPEGNIAGTHSVPLPERVAGYESKAVPVDHIVLNWLPKDTTYAQRRYKAPDGFEIQMNVVLMGSDRTSIHQPQYCLEGNGLRIERTEVDTIPINQPRTYQLPVKKLTASRMEKGVKVQAVYVYWFVAENRLTAEHGQRMIEMGLDMLRTGVLQRWAYVACLSFCYPGQEEATYARIKGLINATVPEFQLTTGEPATLARNP